MLKKHLLPNTVEEMGEKKLYVVPMNYLLYSKTDAICLTGPNQVWIRLIHARYMHDTCAKHAQYTLIHD